MVEAFIYHSSSIIELLIVLVQCMCNANEFFYRESLAAGSLDQLPAPLERIPADA
jgi:hypothetical protein